MKKVLSLSQCKICNRFMQKTYHLNIFYDYMNDGNVKPGGKLKVRICDECSEKMDSGDTAFDKQFKDAVRAAIRRQREAEMGA